jgi:hypothetical protein
MSKQWHSMNHALGKLLALCQEESTTRTPNHREAAQPPMTASTPCRTTIFRNYRTKYGYGGDFVIYSDVRRKRLAPLVVEV